MAIMFPTATLLQHRQAVASAAAVSAVCIGTGLYLLLRRRLTPAEREQRRRSRLAAIGRIIDGTLIDTNPPNIQHASPHALIYRYRVAGVEYECGQDVSSLAPHLPRLGPADEIFGLPVQVRYDRDNPADSIVIAETWNGLWNKAEDHSHAEPK